MTLSLVPLGLLPFLRLLTTTAIAGWMSSPMSWSSDGEWLSHTAVVDADPSAFPPGWVLLPPTNVRGISGQEGPTSRPAVPPTSMYRIWATRRDQQSSVLIEESHSPLTAPAWSPRGKSIAFGRFVAQSIEPAPTTERGRYEVVIQDGLDRKQVVWTTADFELDPAARAAMPYQSCSWSPDGMYLAIPRPGPHPAVEIVRTDTKRRVLVLNHAILPTWSPDGSKCAFIRHENNANRLDYVERRGQNFDEPRPVAVVGSIAATPSWTGDSRSIFVVQEKTPTRNHELEIFRVVLENIEAIRVMTLVPEPAKRGAVIRGLAIDFDHETERCFFSVCLEGRDTDVVWCLPRDRGTVHKRFHPLDVSQRVAGISISPDGQLVAMRFESSHGLMPPIIYDTETEQTTLVVADLDARQEWLGELAGTARRILAGALPPAMVDGQVAERPTVFPLPGELQAHDASLLRLKRLAAFGSALCAIPTDEREPAKRQATGSFELEARLFFDYLRGDYPAASVDLDHLEPLLLTPRERLALLSVRAQLFWARGELSQARAVIDYLVSCGDPNRRLVEETPLGLSFSPAVSPEQLWAHYVSALAAHGIETKSPPDTELPTDVFDPRLQLPAGPPAGPIIERGAGPIPFAPRREIP